jgi:hypothetical protein
MLMVGEAGHVRAGLGDDHLRGLGPDAGDGLEPFDQLCPRLGLDRDPLTQRVDGVVEPVDVVEQLA